MANALTPTYCERFDRQLKSLPILPRPQLIKGLEEIKIEIEKVIRHYGFRDLSPTLKNFYQATLPEPVNVSFT